MLGQLNTRTLSCSALHNTKPNDGISHVELITRLYTYLFPPPSFLPLPSSHLPSFSLLPIVSLYDGRVVVSSPPPKPHPPPNPAPNTSSANCQWQLFDSAHPLFPLIAASTPPSGRETRQQQQHELSDITAGTWRVHVSR